MIAIHPIRWLGQLLVVLMKQFIVFNGAIRTDPRSTEGLASAKSNPSALCQWIWDQGLLAVGY